MSAITIENDLVHYEVLGRGRPVIFLHGWLGSWRYWVPAMQLLSTKYRTYALDMWGFGDSGKDPTRYSLNEQVALLHEFMEKLGIPKAALVGHSFGATVALRYAVQHPDRAPRLMLVSPPLVEIGEDRTPMPVLENAAASRPAAAASEPTARASAAAQTTPPLAPAAAPVQPSTASVPPATATTSAAPAAPAPTPTAGGSTPATPATQAAAPGAAPVPTTTSAAPVPPPPLSGTTPAVPAEQPAASTGEPTPLPPGSSSDTLVRNPLKGLGGTTDEILARAQASNIAKVNALPPASPATPAAPAVPATPTAQSAPPAAPPVVPPPPQAPAKPAADGPNARLATGPLLPTTLAKPIVSPAPVTPAPPVPVSPTPVPTPPVQTAVAAPSVSYPSPAVNPLTNRLVGIKPTNLLARHSGTLEANDADKLRAEVEKTDEQAIARSVGSFSAMNMVADLKRLSVPVLLLHGRNDTLLGAPGQDLLEQINQTKAKGQFLPIVEEDLYHFPMLEISAKFNRLLMDFLDATDLVNIQFKDQWKRTIR
ncbi:MAG TPA: alpha/beta hydrolase [Aggregatilineales bacterium]|nr:alpha/beta hydrolase [Aggregatilineales bacterium]